VARLKSQIRNLKTTVTEQEERLEFCLKFLDDLKNRHLIVCHKCEADTFRFKSVSIASDFERLLSMLAPYRADAQ
jgi:hypothetical protein